MKIAILGAGSLGCVIGGVLTEAGQEVWLINRHPDRVAHLREHGLLMRVGQVDRRVAVKAAVWADEVGPADLVVVLVKSFHTDDAMAQRCRCWAHKPVCSRCKTAWATKISWPAM